MLVPQFSQSSRLEMCKYIVSCEYCTGSCKTTVDCRCEVLICYVHVVFMKRVVDTVPGTGR